MSLFKPRGTIEQIWYESWAAFKRSFRGNNKEGIKQSTTWFICVVWGIWKQRNERVFRGNNMPPGLLAKRILQDGRLWLNYCWHEVVSTWTMPYWWAMSFFVFGRSVFLVGFSLILVDDVICNKQFEVMNTSGSIYQDFSKKKTWNNCDQMLA